MKYNMKRIIPSMQNIVDNFLFSYFLLYLEIKDINMTIKVKDSKKINIDEYCGIVGMHISNTTVATIKKIISLLFTKSPV